MKAKLEFIRNYFRETSFILWYLIITIATLVIFTIFNGQQLPKIVFKVVLYFCQFLWGLTGFTLIFKDKVVFGPITIEGNFVKVIGWSIILVNWLTIISNIVFDFEIYGSFL